MYLSWGGGVYVVYVVYVVCENDKGEGGKSGVMLAPIVLVERFRAEKEKAA